MTYEEFQRTFEEGMERFFLYCLQDDTFQNRHPLIQWLLKPEQKANADGKGEDIHIFDDMCHAAAQATGGLRKEYENPFKKLAQALRHEGLGEAKALNLARQAIKDAYQKTR